MITKSNILEQSLLKTPRGKLFADAIKNRRKISFVYYGPTKTKKDFEGKKIDSVLPGKRVKVEPVALGLNKKGNLVIRAWIGPPTLSKKGFKKTNWRTYLIGRMRDIQVTDEIYTEKRPGYKEGNDKSFSVTYVTPDWTKTPPIKPTTKPEVKPKQVKKPEEKPQVTPKPTELPQPKPTEKPKPQVTPKPEIKPEEKPQPKPETKPTDNKEKPKEELPQPKPTEKPEKNPEDENKLQESINRIKTLMLI